MAMLKKIFNRVESRELGFGSSVGTGQAERLMNPDGSMNVCREATSRWDNIYRNLITMPGWLFIALVFGVYFVVNCFFACLYLWVGVEHLTAMQPGALDKNFWEAFFFSTQTLTTVGYGRIAPQGVPANVLASLESLIGLLSFALISGLLYGRFSRPVAHIAFSPSLLVSPYKDGWALMLRMVNSSRSELIHTEAQMIGALNQLEGEKVTRKYFALELELKQVSFFSLSWTLVHPLNDKSPLHGFSAEELEAGNLEILVLIKAVEDANEATVHARRSYMAAELVWHARFLPIIGRTKKGIPFVETSRVGEFELVTV